MIAIKNLLILDDCLLEKKQNKAEAYYTRGRHNNCDTIYIAQNYILLPKNTIRENSNILLLFPQDKRDLQRIHADHCTDIDYEEFKDFCHDVWSNRYNFCNDRFNEFEIQWKVQKEFRYILFPSQVNYHSFIDCLNVNMSFYRIHDANKRDAIVSDYSQSEDNDVLLFHEHVEYVYSNC